MKGNRNRLEPVAVIVKNAREVTSISKSFLAENNVDSLDFTTISDEDFFKIAEKSATYLDAILVRFKLIKSNATRMGVKEVQETFRDIDFLLHGAEIDKILNDFKSPQPKMIVVSLIESTITHAKYFANSDFKAFRKHGGSNRNKQG